MRAVAPNSDVVESNWIYPVSHIQCIKFILVIFSSSGGQRRCLRPKGVGGGLAGFTRAIYQEFRPLGVSILGFSAAEGGLYVGLKFITY